MKDLASQEEEFGSDPGGEREISKTRKVSRTLKMRFVTHSLGAFSGFHLSFPGVGGKEFL